MQILRPVIFSSCIALLACGSTTPVVPQHGIADSSIEDTGDEVFVSDSTSSDIKADITLHDVAYDSSQPEVDPNKPACQATDPRAVPITISVQPDEGETPYTSFIAKATKSIRIYAYIMGTGATLTALKSKAQSGVKITAIFDGPQQKSVNQKAFDDLTALGAQVKWSDAKFSYMHAKSIVIDDKEALIATGNFDKTYVLSERNYVAYNGDAQDVKVLSSLFDADFNGQSPNVPCTRLLISPINAKQRLLDLVNGAKKTIVIHSMQFGETEIRNAVANRKAAGVDVKVLLADPAWITSNTDAGNFLKSKNIEARWITSPEVHVKNMVVDGQWAYMGSENLSYTSLTKNREVGLLLNETAALELMSKTFAEDWAKAKNF